MAKKVPGMVIRFRMDLSPTCSIGPGKIDLLEAIQAVGTLRAAARRLGFSYRRAWDILNDLNNTFSKPVTTAHIGGVGGGAVRLTETGMQVVNCYRSAAQKIEPRVRSVLSTIAAKAVLRNSRKPGVSRKRICRPIRAAGV